MGVKKIVGDRKLHDDPRWVDWSTRPTGYVNQGRGIPLSTCGVCGRAGEAHGTGLGPVSDRNPAAIWVHGGIYYSYDPYASIMGDRPTKEWCYMLAIREECHL